MENSNTLGPEGGRGGGNSKSISLPSETELDNLVHKPK